ncbi:teichoic acid D-Ala incorporation-associated protein DltX [Lactobacillus corticis]|uniref:D-Ala-teichoic acid biosynthesis protein n=1 Tax=Lactobacillus corticis TaxID=2201249 RepID=A0A916QGC6_9LACO|nr:teichoic acid D-Ala incorporation-associated protein DltX [Lactobacillus corticis]GFZ26484.1 D-Ala-teichoic acid biosynthesis protein [Lactobacillus corticis]
MERNKTRTPNRWKQVGLFLLKTVCYFAILMALIYLYEYSGLTSVHFIYNEF